MGGRQNGLSRIKGTLISLGISKIIKSTGKVNLPNATSTFSAIPFGYFTVLSANSTVNLVRLRKGTVICLALYNGVLFCPVDRTYWLDPIQRIEFESALIEVEIDLSSLLGVVSVERGSLPNSLIRCIV
ncbi:hypothetical protein Tco_0588694 [Tanacetum coccineum]